VSHWKLLRYDRENRLDSHEDTTLNDG